MILHGTFATTILTTNVGEKIDAWSWNKLLMDEVLLKIVPCNITLRLGFNAFNGIILLHEVLLHVGIFRRNLPVACAFLVCHSLVKLFFYFSFLSYLASSLATFSRRSVNISLSNMISIRKFSFCFSTSAKKQQDT